MTTTADQRTRGGPEVMVLFAFIWANQALVHQDFFPHWLAEGNIFGWLLVGFAVATLLYPKSLLLLSAMLVSSIVYHFGEWPWVANHLVLLVVVDLTILAAVVSCAWSAWRQGKAFDSRLRAQIYARFAPILAAILVALYYIILVSKLNWDFVNLDTSCLTHMYQDVVDRFHFLPVPTADWAVNLALWVFLAVELLIPVFLMYKRTRYAAILIGLPFHLLLGLIGHRTFSAFVYAMYLPFVIQPLAALLGDVKSRVNAQSLGQLVSLLRIVVPVTGVAAAAIYLTGDYPTASGVLSIFRYGPQLWLLWACVLAGLITTAIIKDASSRRSNPPLMIGAPTPGWMWVFFGLAFVNGLAPYIGLKTQTSYTMYSNLRTEAGVNNHMFMPAFRLTDYQDDFVEVISTDHPEIQQLSYAPAFFDRSDVHRKKLINYFELRRLVSETARPDFHVEYIRLAHPSSVGPKTPAALSTRHADSAYGPRALPQSAGQIVAAYPSMNDAGPFSGQRYRYVRRAGIGPDVELAQPHPYLLGKLLRFREIFAGVPSYCQH